MNYPIIDFEDMELNMCIVVPVVIVNFITAYLILMDII